MLENDSDNEIEKENTEEDLMERIHMNISRARKDLADWRESAKRCYDFDAGRHWTTEDVEKLQDEGRVAITFNRIPRIVNAVCGLETQNRQEPKFLPRTIDDSGLNDIANGAMKWVRDQCDAEDEDSQMFSDVIKCGYGWTETWMDYDENPDGEVKLDRIDPFEMLYDTTAKKKNLSDRRWQCHIKKLPMREIKQMWPDIDLSYAEFNFDYGDNAGQPHDADNAWKYENDVKDKNEKNLMGSLGHYQEWDKIPYFKVVNEATGEVEDLSFEQYKSISEKIKTLGYKVVRMNKKVFKRVFFIGKKKLQADILPCEDFTFKATTGLHDRNENTFYGLIMLMIDPQMWANKWLTQILHIINSNAKGGIFYEQGAFTNISKATSNLAKPNGMIPLSQGGLGKIKEREAPRYPEGLDRILQYAVSAVNDVTGVSLEMLGMSDRDQPYALEALRQRQGTLILSPFFDSLRRYRKEQGRLMLKFIRDYISDGRLVRIVGEQGSQYVPLLKDRMAEDYDIIVDDAPTSPNVKERVSATLMPIIQTALTAGIPIPPAILDYLPLPESLVTEWKKMLQGDPMQAQMQQAMQELEYKVAQLDAMDKEITIQKKAAETRAVDSEITLNVAKAQQASAIGQDESAQAAQKLGLVHQEAQAKQRGILVEQIRKDVESMAGIQRKMMESKANIEIKREQARSAQTSGSTGSS